MKYKLIPLAFLISVSCNADTSNYKNYEPEDFGGGGPIKQFHVQGRHYCQSMDAFFSCDIDLRDATDCGSGHMRLQQVPYICCKTTWANGKLHPDAMSINYVPGACSPLF